MKYLFNEPFSFYSNDKYRGGWEKIFGKKKLPKVASKNVKRKVKQDEKSTCCDGDCDRHCNCCNGDK